MKLNKHFTYASNWNEFELVHLVKDKNYYLATFPYDLNRFKNRFVLFVRNETDIIHDRLINSRTNIGDVMIENILQRKVKV